MVYLLAVEFVGWVSDQVGLAKLLLSLDVVVNPSLRAWSETFCIANIEAMSLERPLVTFAIGGTGTTIVLILLFVNIITVIFSFSIVSYCKGFINPTIETFITVGISLGIFVVV